MTPKIDDVIAYEIKKDIADRYFGFRKLIEEDELDLQHHIRQQSFILEKRISFDLIRLVILLKGEELIASFFDMTSLDKDRFFDPFFVDAPTIRERVFEGVKIHGLTKFKKFRNLVLDSYERLTVHTAQYMERYRQLQEEKEVIDEEIKLFYQKNDLGSIMGFLRSLGDTKSSGSMQGGMEIGMAQSLEKKMAIPPPLPIENYLPVIDPLPPLDNISKKLKKLIDQAYKLHDQEAILFFITEKPAVRR
ncbi:MAG: hypothetical protein KQH63_08970 [Desulfobulbaceae bacterium]|nr:hypothetical protein [Desulfobulbaceae bacterium]